MTGPRVPKVSKVTKLPTTNLVDNKQEPEPKPESKQEGGKKAAIKQSKVVLKREVSDESESDSSDDDAEPDDQEEEHNSDIEDSVHASDNDDADADVADEVEADSDCMYKHVHNRKQMDLNDVEEDVVDIDDEVYDDDQVQAHEVVITEPDERKSKMILYRYEYVRALGERANMLASGAKPMIKNVEHLPPKEIARLELEKGVMPYIIQRKLPDGTIERFNINELKRVN